MPEAQGPSTLGVEILRAVAHAKSIEGLARTTRISPVALGRELAKLQIDGYLDERGEITDKGLRVIKG